jgi:hypothetical protein
MGLKLAVVALTLELSLALCVSCSGSAHHNDLPSNAPHIVPVKVGQITYRIPSNYILSYSKPSKSALYPSIGVVWIRMTFPGFALLTPATEKCLISESADVKQSCTRVDFGVLGGRIDMNTFGRGAIAAARSLTKNSNGDLIYTVAPTVSLHNIDRIYIVARHGRKEYRRCSSPNHEAFERCEIIFNLDDGNNIDISNLPYSRFRDIDTISTGAAAIIEAFRKFRGHKFRGQGKFRGHNT